MPDKNYEVKTPLRRNGKAAVESGTVISLDEKIAAPLVECGALVEQLEKDTAGKGKGKGE